MTLPRNDQALLAQIFDEMPQPAFWMKPVQNEAQEIIDFTYTICNREFYTYIQSSEEVLGRKLLTSPIVPTEAMRQEFFEQIKGVYQTGTRMSGRMYNPLVHRYYSYSRSKVADGVLTVLQDRTEEFSIIQRLEEQTHFTNNLLSHSPSGISVTRVIRNSEGTVVDGRTILTNEVARSFNAAAGIDENKSIAETDPGVLESPLYQLSLHTLRTAEPFHVQYFFEPGNKWIELSVAKMDEDHLINIFTDITSTKSAQLQLEQAATRLEAVFNAAQSGMFIFSPVCNEEGELVDFRFVITNPSFAAYVNQQPETLNGALGSTWFPGYLTNGVFDMYKHTYCTGTTNRREVHYQVDGLDLYLDLRSTKVGDELLVTFNDYTPLKKAQLELERTVVELKRSNVNLEEFAYAASHDLKEPVRKVHTFADMLRNSLGPRLTEMEVGLFQRMIQASQRMMLLVDDLLSFSQYNIVRQEKETVDLNKKLRIVMADLELLIEEKSAQIEAGPLPVVQGYKRQLQQLLHNLLINSLKYARAGVPPQISISARTVTAAAIAAPVPAINSQQRYHFITITDNGIGFEQKHAEKIFGVFQRLHGRSEYAGTGIGLSIVRKVVENHGGYIWAKGEPGVGSWFFILLPVQSMASN